MSACKDFTCTLAEARMAGKQAIAMLAEQHLPLVLAMVRRFPWCGHEREELYQQGCVGLMKALARYDPEYGTCFSTYAAAMILGEMRMLYRLDSPLHVPRRERELRGKIRRAERMLTAQIGREPTVQEVALVLRMQPAELMLTMEQLHTVSLDKYRHADTRNLHEVLSADDGWLDRILIKDLVTRLPKEDQRLLLLRYRMGKTQAETARILGLSQVQVSRRENQIKMRLRSNWNSE